MRPSTSNEKTDAAPCKRRKNQTAPVVTGTVECREGSGLVEQVDAGDVAGVEIAFFNLAKVRVGVHRLFGA